MKIFIIGSVRGADETFRNRMEHYVKNLENNGHSVHLPHRDTDQNVKGFDICIQNMEAIKNSDEVHIFYRADSQGSHFDLGITFVLNKRIKVIESPVYGEGKSFPRMLHEWQNKFLKGN